MTDNLTRTDSRLATLGSVLANWRDWNLPVKLAAVTLVPVVFAIVLGAMQIADQVDRASSYRRVDRLVVVNEELRTLVTALQRERTAGAVLLAARSTDIGTELRPEHAAVDGARDEFTRAAGRVTLDEEIAAARYDEVRAWLNELRGVREQVSGSLIDASTALDRYTDVIDALLRFDRALSAEAIDPGLVAASTAQHDLEAVGEQIHFQHALVGIGIVRGGLVGPDLEALRASLARLEDSTVNFHAVAGGEHTQAFDRLVTEQVVAGRTNLVGAIAASQPGARIPVTRPEWKAASDAAASGVAGVADALGRQLRDRSAALQDEASDGAGLAAVILLVALVVAIAVMFVVGRHLVSSLSTLRRSALDVAEQRLPAAVARIRDRGEDADTITLEPVPVKSMDEVGEVARAFEAVQQQALRLATEQAGLRAQYSSVFVNLSRRSQGLVQRQLHLLERLERDEEDADQLATLFQLDHLATRMRRNNENLMVLSGSDVGRRNQRPAALADLLRAAVSEIEQYQRVVSLPPPNVLVVGYAVGDIVRLIAELLDNATSFSAPDTSVTIASHLFEDGSVCVAVLDEGIGMNQEELDEANAKLADTASIDVSTSRRMGLFVIGRLAGRHGIEVRLNGGHDVVGVRATVTVPAELVTQPPADRPRSQRSTPLVGVPSSGLVPFSPAVNGHRGGVNGTHSPTNGTNGGLSALPRRTTPGSLGESQDSGPTGAVGGGSGFVPAGDAVGDGAGAEFVRQSDDQDGSAGGTAMVEEGADRAEAVGGSADGAGSTGEASGFEGAEGAGRTAAANPTPATDGPAAASPTSVAGGGSVSDGAWVADRSAAADGSVGVGRTSVAGGGSVPDGTSVADRPAAVDGSAVADRISAADGSAGGDRTSAAGGSAVSDRAWAADGAAGASRASVAGGRSASDGTSAADRTPAPDRTSAVDGTALVDGSSAAGRSAAVDGNVATGGTSATDRSAVDHGTATTDRTGAVEGASAADRSSATDQTSPTDRTSVGTASGTGAPADPGTAPAGHSPTTPGAGERMPLPRRSPGRPGANRLDVTRPRTPFTPATGPVTPADGLFSPSVQPPPARAPRPRPGGGPPPAHRRPGSLFTPAGQQGGSWWTPRGPDRPVDPRALDETTPIFDEMVSAWFRAVSEPPARQPTPPTEPWRFDADAGFDAARAASKSEPAEFTDSGLPRRNPRQNLVPGSIANSPTTGPPRHSKAAEDLRQRLSNYRHGVRRARDHQPGAPLDLSGAGWRFAADVGWRAANAVSTSTPVDFTSGGLPRRTPQDNLLPGSATPNFATGGPPRSDRAEELRGRLGSFQKGLSRGRRSLAERASANGNREHKQQERE